MRPEDSVISGVERCVLDNGLTVLTREDHAVPIVTTMVWYRVGSRYEKPGKTGISHFLEHMMFKGSSRYGKGEIDDMTTRNGGTNNAFTANDYTAYYFSFASDRWTTALEVEADRMHSNSFDPREFEVEKRVVIEELKMEIDSPWGALRQTVEKNAFRRHPYRFPIIGLYEDVAAITLDDMIAHYERFYVPSNAILVLVGDFKTAEAMKQVEELFGGLPAGTPPQLELPGEIRGGGPVRLSVARPSHVARLLVAFPAPSVRQRDHYAVHLVDKVLSEGKLARLYRRLVEKEKLASLVSTDFADTFDPYLFFVQLELLEGASPVSAERVLFEELAELSQSQLSEGELERARNQCLMAFLSGFETTLDQAVQLGLLETLERYEYWCGYPEEIRNLPASEIREVCSRYLVADTATIAWVDDRPD